MLQNKKKEYICEICGNEFLNKYNLSRHTKQSCKGVTYTCVICGQIGLSQQQLKLHTHTADEIQSKIQSIEELKSKIKEYEDKIFTLASKPHHITNNHNNNIRIEKLQPLILHRSIIEKLVEDKYTYEYWNHGQAGIARFARDYILQDEKGNLQYICTDQSRGIYLFRNTFNNVVKDIESKHLSSRLADVIIPKSNIIYLQQVQKANDENDILKKNVYDSIQCNIRELRYNNKQFKTELAIITSCDNDVLPFFSDDDDCNSAMRGVKQYNHPSVVEELYDEEEEKLQCRRLNIGDDEDNEYVIEFENEEECDKEFEKRVKSKIQEFQKLANNKKI